MGAQNGTVLAAPRRRTAGVLAVALVAVLALALVLVGVTWWRDDTDRVPAADDYVAIDEVPRVASSPAPGPDASTGTFVSRCGRNEDGHQNWDNLIVSPGERDAAHHLHEYVGNTATDALATDDRLTAAGTTCSNGDPSAYYWPVLRDLGEDGGATERYGNEGVPLDPVSVHIEYRGNAASEVVPLPRFLRMVTGDSRAATSDVPAATPRWSCSGDEDRHTARYPLCPDDELAVRTFDFPSCWDGRRLDSPDHRSHVVFPSANGVCPDGTFAVPQLRLQVAYDVPPGRSFAIDSMPEQARSPRTDHADFVNVMPEALMAEVVACLNEGQAC